MVAVNARGLVDTQIRAPQDALGHTQERLVVEKVSERNNPVRPLEHGVEGLVNGRWNREASIGVIHAIEARENLTVVGEAAIERVARDVSSEPIRTAKSRAATVRDLMPQTVKGYFIDGFFGVNGETRRAAQQATHLTNHVEGPWIDTGSGTNT